MSLPCFVVVKQKWPQNTGKIITFCPPVFCFTLSLLIVKVWQVSGEYNVKIVGIIMHEEQHKTLVYYAVGKMGTKDV